MTTITRTEFSPGWDSGARSIATFAEDGGASFQVGQCIGIVCGLNTLDEGVDYREIQHAFFVASGKYRIIDCICARASPSRSSVCRCDCCNN